MSAGNPHHTGVKMTSTEQPQHAEQTRSTWTREAWLEAAVEVFRPKFDEVGYPLPKRVHVSVGFANGARAESGKILGQCWKARASEDGIPHVFVSPESGDTVEVAETLLHELIHVADDVARPDERLNHKGIFAEIATRLGFMGPMTATPAGIELAAELMTIVATLGDFPHGKLNVPSRKPVTAGAPVGGGGVILSSGPKPQTNRYHVAVCDGAECDGYRVRMVAKHIERGLPLCGICGERMRLA